MFKPVALFIGLRYIRTRKKSQIISFVSIVSTLGITIGVLALIVVTSVINGSTSTMRDETLKAVPHASVSAGSGDWPGLRDALAARPGILGVAPYVEGESWLRFDGAAEFVQLRGVDPRHEAQVLQVRSPDLDAMLQALADTDNGIILGIRLANRLGIRLDEEVTLLSLPSLLNRKLDESMHFRVIGAADFGFYGNDNTVMVDLQAAQTLFGLDESGQDVRLRLRVDDILNAGPIAANALQTLPDPTLAAGRASTSWSETQASLFDALRLEKTMTGFMLLMIVVIGAVNIVSTLVMVVADKSADIAILRTMGATRGTVQRVFFLTGAAIGVAGTLGGFVTGLLICLNTERIRQFISWISGVDPFNPELYYLAQLPARMDSWQTVLIVAMSLGLSFAATLYPSWRAAKLDPVEALRYE